MERNEAAPTVELSAAQPVTAGVHHVTAVAADPQACVDFCVGVLGLRLVKRTVDPDDPTSYHLYFGDAAGTPGTLLTFLVPGSAGHGRRGTGEVAATALTVPPGSFGYWMDRFAASGVEFEPLARRFGDEVLAFAGPDGLGLELAADGEGPAAAAGETAISGVHSVTLSVRDGGRTAHTLTSAFGFRAHGAETGRLRFIVPPGSPGTIVDVVVDPVGAPGVVGSGIVDHLAFRVGDGRTLSRWRRELVAAGFAVSPVMDCGYFRSVYLREPHGVLFELATDAPGLAVDEPAGKLGATLKLPPWLEPLRSRLEFRLASLHGMDTEESLRRPRP